MDGNIQGSSYYIKDIDDRNNTNYQPFITTKTADNTYGVNMAIQSAQRMYVGAGESATAMLNNEYEDDSEHLVLCADTNVYIVTNLQGVNGYSKRKVNAAFYESGNTEFNHDVHVKGNVGIGTKGTIIQDAKLKVDGDIRMLGTLHVAGSVRTTHINFSNSGNTYIRGGTMSSDVYINDYSSGRTIIGGSVQYQSDDRLKFNEKFINNATDTLLKLRPQVYDKAPKLFNQKDNEKDLIQESGLIAQEIYYDCPELRHLVSIPDDASNIEQPPSNYHEARDNPDIDADFSNWGSEAASVNYFGLIPYLIQGFKEQQKMFDEQQKTIDELKDLLVEKKSINL